MTVIFGFMKFVTICVYGFFLLGAVWDIHDDFFGDGKNKSPYPKLDVLYLFYTFGNLITLIKVLLMIKL